ncbi:trypsin-1-like isoform X2 [Daphnia pulex]|uniref:trypsin-1-like isoform X2 n=1 Tax=Daphnia pulex TaxID=6669 RepID=UPI001EDE6411|nr:trypsin-1-like isoform X2 [Daphnia pulex]XP_046451631.1 trypsin-1-like isoform X2 [Daphnia pulex]XP_046451632.1 trypsin-1-like isoform X2 [Daphnia pulex]
MILVRPLVVAFLAAALLLGSESVNGRIYQTDDAIIVEAEDHDRDKNSGELKIPFWFESNYFKTNGSSSSNDVEQTTQTTQTTSLTNSSLGMVDLFDSNVTTTTTSTTPTTTTTVTTTTTTTTTTMPFVEEEPVFPESSCGVGPAKTLTMEEQRIVGGTEAVKNSWPGIVALKKNGTFICGGSLIARNKILTAAHCVVAIPQREVKLLTVELGIHSLLPSKKAGVITKKVRRMTRHRRFNPRTFFNDIAILTLESNVDYKSTISPVCLPSANSNAEQYADKDATIIGWGTLIEGGFQSAVLQQVTVQLMTNAKCQSFYAGKDKIFDHMMCAAAPGKDSCQGDSGGPLLVQPSPGSPWIQAGIVSWGIGCARPEYPGVFIRVASFLNWIRRNTRS